MISYSQLLLDMIGKILERGIAPADGMIRAVLFDQSETIEFTLICEMKKCSPLKPSLIVKHSIADRQHSSENPLCILQ